MQRKLLRLLAIQGIGPRRAIQLLDHFKDLDTLFTAKRADLMQIRGVSQILANEIRAEPDQELLDGQEKLIERYNVTLLPYWDERYPQLLKEIYDPPVALFMRGDREILGLTGLAIVGTRSPSAYGLEVAEQLSRELARLGYAIISGAARGIDTVVHRTTMMAGENTIAVLGNGLDRAYPAENRGMLEEIGNRGLLLSEFLMGTKPDAPNFPRRNRVISGLSRGVIVVEAAERSGSLITAYIALDQNREVFAVPGSIYSQQSIGTNRLIRQGARLVGTAEDILAEIGERYRLGISKGQTELEIALEPEEKKVLAALSKDAQYVDELAVSLDMATFTLLGILLQLEMKGLVRQLPGKHFVRKGNA